MKNKIFEYVNANVLESQRQIKTFGIIFFINYPLYYIIWTYASVQSYESLSLRLSASLFCLPLIFIDYWRSKFNNFFPFYWYFTVIYCLPFFFLFMTLNNHGSATWLLNLLLQIFLTFLLFDLIGVIIVNLLGFSSALFIYILIQEKEIIFDPSTINAFGALGTIVATFVIGSIFVHNRDKIERAKLETIKSIGASIAHELRTPLRSISSAAGGIKDHFPKILEGYQIAKKKELPVPYINPIHYEILLTACDDIQSETEEAFTVINMLLMNVTESVNTKDFKTCSINYCIDETLRRYPFDMEEAKLVHWQGKNDFFFKGNELLIIHILFNLLKNSFYQIKAVHKGVIQIWTESKEKYNILHFKDTAKGISPQALPHIFDRFYTRTYHGTGIGLAFCKIVMENLGGKITCRSVEDEYAEFLLYFPCDKNLSAKDISRPQNKQRY